MNSLAHLLGTAETNHPVRNQFMKWQCRVRQIAMREKMGRPDEAIMPEVTPAGANTPIGHIITVISKSSPHSKTPELQHMFKCTNDPAQRREKALEFFSEIYFQKPGEFSDILTAAFNPGSHDAAELRAATGCSLRFQGYGHNFNLACSVETLEAANVLYQATWWHNALFNPNMPPETEILAFIPDWSMCSRESE
jgi:hypothetical protein